VANVSKKLISSVFIFFVTGIALRETYAWFGVTITLSLILSFVLGFVVCYTFDKIFDSK